MIEISIHFEDGLLRSCFIEGHAKAGPRGKDIICAAVSVLARTAWQVLSARKGVTVLGKAVKRGEFSFEVTACKGEEPFLAGVGAFLTEGLESVVRDYPKNCRVVITNV
ncbi:MAG: ribosomal-processing cysteine protease Prp [Treponema sp.]|nr:ribosomal-processing cysteine protease Prp [Treponema sp.]